MTTVTNFSLIKSLGVLQYPQANLEPGKEMNHEMNANVIRAFDLLDCAKVGTF